MSESYKFIGVLNLFNVYPDFLFPIYQKNDKLFFHNGEKNQIFNFDEVSNSILDKIIYIDNTDTDIHIVNNTNSEYYFNNSEPVYAFQNDEHEIFCSDLGEMLHFLSTFTTEDAILKKQIDLFISENISEAKKHIFDSIDSDYAYFRHYPFLSKDNNCIKNALISVKPLASSQLTPVFLNKALSLPIKNLADSLEIITPKLVDLNDIQSYINTFLINSSQAFADYTNLGFRIGNSFCEVKNVPTYKTGFNDLKSEFDTMIKNIPFTSPMYDVCIKCQNAIINEDEDELILIINKNLNLFYTTKNMAMQNGYLFEYVQNHLYPNTFEYL